MLHTTCPCCKQDTAMYYHGGYSTEPHGEQHWDEWYTCGQCGEILDEKDIEWDKLNEQG